MDTLYLMVTITDRKLEKKFLNFYREQGLEVSLTTLGHGTASSEIRDFFGRLQAEIHAEYDGVTLYMKDTLSITEKEFLIAYGTGVS